MVVCISWENPRLVAGIYQAACNVISNRLSESVLLCLVTNICSAQIYQLLLSTLGSYYPYHDYYNIGDIGTGILRCYLTYVC